MRDLVGFPTFPVTYQGEGEYSGTYASFAELASDLEFVEDDDSDYICLDSEGTRVRLIVYQTELLLFETVPSDFSRESLQISESAERGTECLVETVNSRASRLAYIIGDKASGVAPETWQDELAINFDRSLVPSQVSVKTFNGIWMRARLGRRYARLD